MHDAQRQAAVLFDEIVSSAPELLTERDPERKYFLQSHPISVHSCLRYVSRAYGLDKPLKVTWLRSMFARMAKKHDVTTHKGIEGETAQELFAKVAHTNKHSVPVADSVYARLTPAEDAMLAKHNYLRLMGEPVPFPTKDIWDAQGPPIEVINVARAKGGQGCPDDKFTEYASDVEVEEEGDEEDEDEIAKALFGGSDEHVLVDDVVDDEEKEILSDIDPADREKDEWDHIIAICDEACDEAVLTLTQNDDMLPMPGAHDKLGIAEAATDSPKSTHVARSQDAVEKGGILGKHARRLQRRISMEKIDKKKKEEKRKRHQKKLRKQAAVSDDMSHESHPSGKRKKNLLQTQRAQLKVISLPF